MTWSTQRAALARVSRPRPMRLTGVSVGRSCDRVMRLGVTCLHKCKALNGQRHVRVFVGAIVAGVWQRRTPQCCSVWSTSDCEEGPDSCSGHRDA